MLYNRRFYRLMLLKFIYRFCITVLIVLSAVSAMQDNYRDAILYLLVLVVVTLNIEVDKRR